MISYFLLSPAVAAGLPAIKGDPVAGQAVYVQCIACHAVQYNRTGPKHCGLEGRPAGSLADFKYTEAMKNAGIVWNATTLDWFLKSPMEAIPGTSMGFAGVKNDTERKNLVAYLLSNKECE